MVELLRESVIVQATLTLVLSLAVIYQSITMGAVDPLLSNAFLITMGFYFGAKVQNITNKATSAIARKDE